METLPQLFERIDRSSDYEYVCASAGLMKQWLQVHRAYHAEIDAYDQETWIANSRNGSDAMDPYAQYVEAAVNYDLDEAKRAAIFAAQTESPKSIRDLLDAMRHQCHQNDDLNRRAVLYLLEDGVIVIDRKRGVIRVEDA